MMDYLNWMAEHWVLTIVILYMFIQGIGNTIICTVNAIFRRGQ
jgi:hypothetical protein